MVEFSLEEMAAMTHISRNTARYEVAKDKRKILAAEEKHHFVFPTWA